jgi:hypothetical protein
MLGRLRSGAVLVALLSAALVLKASLPQVSIGTWQAAGNLQTGRAGAAAVALPDGRILITGGSDANGVPLASADFFNSDGTFSSAPSMNAARSGHAALVLPDGRVLVSGGRTSGGGITNSAETYDPQANSWQMLSATMIEARAGHTASQLLNGDVLLAGGTNSGGPLSALEIFDETNDSFTSVGTLTRARQEHADAVLNDGRVLIAGGTGVDASGNAIALSSTEIYDPDAGSVSAGPPMSAPRARLSATTLLDGTVALIGGNNGSNDLSSIEIYDPAAGGISLSPASLATPRSGHLAFLLPYNSSVLVLGGTSAGSELASAELFVPWNNAVQGTGAMASARSGGAGAPLSTADGLLLVAGGQNSGAGALASGELYGFATVKTDQSDYAPGTTVNITGSGWQPGETVALTLAESPNVDTHPPMTAIADQNGNISNSQFSPDSHDLNVRFYLTAAGTQTQAQTTFTDSTSFGTPSVGPQSPAGVVAGNPATFPVSVNFSGNGTCTVSLSVTSGLPSGTTVQLSPGSGTGTSSADSLSSTLTLTPPAGTTPNSYVFTVRATGTSGNCLANTKNSNGTLAVSGAAASLLVANFPSPITARTPGSFTVTALDSRGNVAAGYTGTVHFASSDSTAVLPADYTFTGAGAGQDNGSHTFSATLNTVGSNQILTASDGARSLSGSQSHINVTAPPTVAVTIATSPSGLQVSLDGGAPQAAPITLNWVPGSAHTIATSSPQSGGAGTQYVWSSWSDGGAISHGVTAPSTATTYTATFKTQYQVTFAQAGMAGDQTGAIVTVNGSPQSILSYQLYVDSGSNVTYSYAGTVATSSTTKQYVLATPDPAPASGFSVTAPVTITATYKTQYQLSFAQTGLSADATGTIVTVNGSPQSTLPYHDWFDDGSSVSFSYSTIVASSVNGKRYSLGSVDSSSPLTVSGPVTVTANYKVQYQLTFAQSGLGADVTGTVVTVNGSPQSAVPHSDWFDDGTSVPFSYSDPVASSSSGKRYALMSVSATSPWTVSAATTITGTYKTQYKITVQQSGIGADVAAGTPIVTVNGTDQYLNTPLFSDWFDDGSTISYSFHSPVASTMAGKRYLLINSPAPASPFSVNGAPVTLNASYKAQYQLTFAATGLAGDATGTIVTVNSNSKMATDLPYSDWFDGGSTVTYAYADPVPSTASGKRYALTTPPPSPASPITVSGAATINAAYKVQWQITFAQGGLGSDATGTVVNVAGNPQSILPYSSWFDSGSSLSFTYSDPVSSNVNGKRYVLAGVDTASPLNISAAATITATYKLQYQLTFTQSGIGLDATGSVTVNGSPQSLPYSTWFDSGSTLSYSYPSPVASSIASKRYILTSPAPSPYSPFTVSVPLTVTATYKAQYDTQTAITSSQNPSILNQTVVFSATVTTVAAGGGTPTGSVQFKIGGSNVGAPVMLSNGVAAINTATLPPGLLPVGTHSVQAAYTPDSDTYTASTGSFQQQVTYAICPLIPQNPPFAVKSGATFPIKLYLCDASANDVSSSAVVVHATAIALLSGASGTLDDAGNSNPDFDFRYDNTLGPSGGYIFNLKTTGLQSGTWLMYFGAGYSPSGGIYSDPANATHAIQFGVK